MGQINNSAAQFQIRMAVKKHMYGLTLKKESNTLGFYNFTEDQIVYSLQYTVCSILYTVYIQYTVYLYSIQYTVYCILYTVYSIQYTVYIPPFLKSNRVKDA